MIKKEDILKKTNTYDILEYYTRSVRGGMALKPMDNFQNPLISKTQATPSFNISHWNGKYYYKDYATGHSGNAFDLVMEMYGLNLAGACAKINQDMNLGLEGGKYIEAERQFKPEPDVLPKDRNYDFSVKFKKWDDRVDGKYWGMYGVDEPTLKMFYGYPISDFHAYNKENKPYQINARFDNPLYFYQRNGWGMVYRPLAKYTNKFYNLGKKPKGYLFGYEQLPKSGKRCYFVGGEKDVVTMRKHGYFACCFNSENSNPDNYPQFLSLINAGRFNEYIFMYDRDEAGIKNMEINAMKYNLSYTILPEMPEGYKDISDWFKLRHEQVLE